MQQHALIALKYIINEWSILSVSISVRALGRIEVAVEVLQMV